MPDSQITERNKVKFYNIKQFPDVVRLIDGIHIPIQCPDKNWEVFRNWKSIFVLLNIQAVCDPNKEIFNIVTRSSGFTHGSRVFNNSSIKQRFDERRHTGYLLGDRDYAESKFTFIPVPNPITLAEERYNKSHEQSKNYWMYVWYMEAEIPLFSAETSYKINNYFSDYCSCCCFT